MKEKTMEKFIELFKEKNSGKKIHVKIKGKSMYPVIPNNSGIEVRIISASELKRGDIAMYHSKKKFFIHRIIGKKGDNFLIKGDNSWKFDSTVKEKSIIGKVTKINKKKIDSLKFNLIKEPIVLMSYITGKISEKIKGKK